MQKTTFLFLSVALLVGGISSGCDSNRLSGLAPCWGTVTWNGEPVEGARVALMPKQESGRSAFGVTDAAGGFKMTTLDTDDGAYQGEYFVTITKKTTVREKEPPLNVTPENLEGRGSRSPQQESIVEQFHIPQKYSRKETSGFEVSISSSGNKNLTFEMTGKLEMANQMK